MYNYYPKPALLPLLHPCPHCSSTMRFVNNLASFVRVHTFIEHHYCDYCIYVIRVRSTSPRFVALHRLVSEMYSLRLFTRTTFSMFTAIIVVCSLKSMCIPSFVFIGCCAHLYP